MRLGMRGAGMWKSSRETSDKEGMVGGWSARDGETLEVIIPEEN